jgi:hypothetical protein
MRRRKLKLKLKLKLLTLARVIRNWQWGVAHLCVSVG